jgi:hypothetical protein
MATRHDRRKYSTSRDMHQHAYPSLNIASIQHHQLKRTCVHSTVPHLQSKLNVHCRPLIECPSDYPTLLVISSYEHHYGTDEPETVARLRARRFQYNRHLLSSDPTHAMCLHIPTTLTNRAIRSDSTCARYNPASSLLMWIQLDWSSQLPKLRSTSTSYIV